MTYNPIDNARYARLLDEGAARGRSQEAPRPSPATREMRARPSVPILSIRPGDDLIGPAIMRISERSERVEKGLAAERIRIEDVRSQPKRETRGVDVESPYGRTTNGMDRVERVIDTIDHMLKAHQIDRGQEAAARRVQEAWALAPNALRCTLSPGAGGAGPGSTSPTEGQLWAGGILNDVRASLGELDAPIVIRIAGVGMSVEEAARIVFGIQDGIKVKQHEVAHVGMRLRMALAVLAKRWRIEGRGGARVVGLRGSVAGHDNKANYGALSAAERERAMPLRSAAEQRDVRLLRKAKRRKARVDAKGKSKEGA